MKRRHSTNQAGVVLLIVLILIAILTTLVVDLIYFTSVDMEIALNSRDHIRAGYLAKSGVNLVAGTMSKKTLEEITAFTSILGAQSGDSYGLWSIHVPPYPIGDGVVSLEVTDERSKINLNALVNRSTNAVDQQVRTQISELSRFLGIDQNKSEEFISSLINWLDSPLEGATNDQEPNGAKGEYYLGLGSPYAIKDGPLDSVDEIKMIKGMDEDYYSRIRDFVTVYPPDKRVNFSTAPVVVIKAVLKSATVSALGRQESGKPSELPDDVAESIAEAIVEDRESNPVLNRRRVNEIIKDVDPTLQIAAGVAGVVHNTGKSEVFRVVATARLGELDPTVKKVAAVLYKTPPSRSERDNSGVEIISWKEL